MRNPVGPADTSLPLKDWTVDDLLADAVARAPHAIALKVNHLETGQIESWTYAQLQAQSRGGENIYPREIEDVLAECPGVVETAVVGVAHEKWGEEVAAAVRCEPGRIVETETLREFLYSRIARHKVPKLWKVVPDFPRTASGKIQKFEVAKWFE